MKKLRWILLTLGLFLPLTACGAGTPTPLPHKVKQRLNRLPRHRRKLNRRRNPQLHKATDFI